MGTVKTAGEDYLEAILELEKDNVVVRSVDIAKRLQVSRPSVNKAMSTLCQAGMVQKEPYGDVVLTQEGRVLAEKVIGRHHKLKYFLEHVLQVSSAVAEEDACRMEHVVSDETMEKLSEFVEKFRR